MSSCIFRPYRSSINATCEVCLERANSPIGNLWLPRCIFIVADPKAWISIGVWCFVTILLCANYFLSVGFILLFSFFNTQILHSRLWDLLEETKQSKQSKATNYRAIPVQKPAFNMELSCHFFISKCTWCTNVNVRIASSIRHNRKQYVCYTWTQRLAGERGKQIFFFLNKKGCQVTYVETEEREVTCLYTYRHIVFMLGCGKVKEILILKERA